MPSAASAAQLVIQPAREADAECVARLINSLTRYFIASPLGEGAEDFLASISPRAIAGYIKDPDFHYSLGFIGTELVGVAALRGNQHLYHLFVHPNFHRQGIARRLWLNLKNTAQTLGNSAGFRVNSSLHAVPVYCAFGFSPIGQPQCQQGLNFQPMTRPADAG